MAQFSKKKMIGLLLCLGAVVIVASGWAYARSNETFTDNAYIRGDMTSLAPKGCGLRHGRRGSGQSDRSRR